MPGLTLRARRVELLHRVIQADSNRGETHLPLESCHQATVETPGALCAYNGGDGAEHPSIPHWGLFPRRHSGFTLDLPTERQRHETTVSGANYSQSS